MPSQNRSDYKSNSGGGGGNGIFGGKRTESANDPSYSAFSVKGLTSSDPANVARNQAAAAKYANTPAPNNKADEQERRQQSIMASAPTPTPRPLPVAPPSMPAPPPTPLPVIPGDMTSTGAAETAALESTKKGLASTIATSAKGLLAEEEPLGLLRRRRSIMGGGLIQ